MRQTFFSGTPITVEPRFWHGQCLAIYSGWCEKYKNKAITKEESAEEIQTALIAGLNAHKFYQTRQNEFTETAHTLEVLDNSLSYLYLCKAKNRKDTTEDITPYLKESRSYLNILESKIKDWSRFPEYYHSEVELEIEEIHQLVEKKAYHQANTKKTVALDTINKTLKLIENKGREVLFDECLELKDTLEKTVIPHLPLT